MRYFGELCDHHMIFLADGLPDGSLWTDKVLIVKLGLVTWAFRSREMIWRRSSHREPPSIGISAGVGYRLCL